jgi:predicted acylesterase/phospholipase RssA/CRP-like cAMP-binding protein
MAKFFPFGKKVRSSDKEGYFLDSIPLFSLLTAEEQALVERYSRLVGFKRGDVVYEEGTPPEAFYLIISGRFRLFSRAHANEKENTILFFYRGEHFGETSLLTGSVHSATVEAKTDAVVLKIVADDFQKLLREIPSFALHLSRSLGRHLTRGELGYSRHRREVRIASVYCSEMSRAMTRFLVDFVSALHSVTQRRILMLDLSGQLYTQLPQDLMGLKLNRLDLATVKITSEGDATETIAKSPHGFDLLSLSQNSSLISEDQRFASLLTCLSYQYDYLVLCLPSRETPVAIKALNYSDRIYLWAENRAEAFSFVAQKTAELCRDFGFNKNEMRIIMPHGERLPEPDIVDEVVPVEIQMFSMLPSLQYQRYRYERMINYLAKEWSEKLVGLVLGSGAAYGLAHIGVLRVLEQEKIPIDIISGSSIGALMGAFWATGLDSYEIEKIARQLGKKNAFFKLLGFGDLSAPHMGFFKGNQVMRFLEPYFKKMTFQDLKIPLKVTAANLLTSEEVIFDSGNLMNAIRASISIPGFFRPFPHRGSFLLDGGIIDPLPIKSLSLMGVRKIIGVNVLPSPKDLIQRNEIRRKAIHGKLQNQLSWRRMMIKTLDRLTRRYTGNIFNVLMNTIQFMEYEIARMQANDADIFIHAARSDGHWIEFFSPDKFIQEGIVRTREQLAEMKRLLVE